MACTYTQSHTCARNAHQAQHLLQQQRLHRPQLQQPAVLRLGAQVQQQQVLGRVHPGGGSMVGPAKCDSQIIAATWSAGLGEAQHRACVACLGTCSIRLWPRYIKSCPPFACLKEHSSSAPPHPPQQLVQPPGQRSLQRNDRPEQFLEVLLQVHVIPSDRAPDSAAAASEAGGMGLCSTPNRLGNTLQTQKCIQLKPAYPCNNTNMLSSHCRCRHVLI